MLDVFGVIIRSTVGGGISLILHNRGSSISMDEISKMEEAQETRSSIGQSLYSVFEI